MNIVAILGFGLIAAVLSVLIRQYRPEFSTILTVLAGAAILVMTVVALIPVVDLIKQLGENAKIDTKFIEILLKALGICYLTQLACDACKDAGESAMASKIEFAGKASVLLLAVPLFTQVLNIVQALIA